MNQELILLPTKELLDKFGAGSHVPGSGSAAAFSGILACKLSLAVIKLTKPKPGYTDALPQIEFIESQLRNRLEPTLFDLFQKDTVEFDQVIKYRRLRDLEEKDTKEYRKFSDLSRDHLQKATEIPLEISEICHQVCRNALSLFDLGFQSARGDSGAAASIALSGANAALFVCYLNLKDFREGKWAVKIRGKCDALWEQSNILQLSLFSRVTKLQEEGIPQTPEQIKLIEP